MHKLRAEIAGLALLLCVLSVAGCMSTKPGPVVDTRPEEKNKVTTSYSVQIVASETASWRDVTLEVKRRSTYKIQYTQRRKELGKRSSTPGWIGLGLGASAVFLGNEITPPCTSDDSPECTTKSEKTKAQTAHLVVMSGMVLGLLGIWMTTKADDGYEPTGDYILDEGHTRTDTTSAAAPSDERISLTLNGTTRSYRTDAHGQISVNMVEDFNVDPTERAPLVVSVVLLNVGHSEHLSINPEEWSEGPARTSSPSPNETGSVRPVGNTAITSDFGDYRRDHRHQGVDFGASTGATVRAWRSGTIVEADWRSGYGKLVRIRHRGPFSSRYAHLSEIDVREGERVRAGDPIGEVGTTGRTTGSHLHFEIRKNDSPVNPLRYLPSRK